MARTWKYSAKHVGWAFSAPFPEDAPQQGRVLGVLARVAKWEYQSVCVCYGLRLDDGDHDLSKVSMQDVTSYCFGEDRGIRDGRWRLIGPVPGFTFETWPLPVLTTFVVGRGWTRTPGCPHVVIKRDDTLENDFYANDGLVSEQEASLLAIQSGIANYWAFEDTFMSACIEPGYPLAIKVTDEALALWARIRHDIRSRALIPLR